MLNKTKCCDDKAMWDTWMSIYQLSVVTVADEIGLFNVLKNKILDIDLLSKKLTVSLPGIKAIVNVLVGLDILNNKDNKINLNAASKNYLLPDSDFYWGVQLHRFRERAEHKALMNALLNSKAQLTFESQTFSDMWKNDTISDAAAEKFTDIMHATIFAASTEAVRTGVFSATKKLLDMGGGSGCFGIAFTDQYPKRKSAVFELPAVCKITKNYLNKYKAIKKVEIITGNFFDDAWPVGFDGILFSQIFHDWPVDYCKKLAKSAYDALPKNGKIYIHEMLLDDNESSPLTVACFNVLMFVNHQSQQFTKKQLSILLRSVGFKKIKVKKTFGYYSVVLAEK